MSRRGARGIGAAVVAAVVFAVAGCGGGSGGDTTTTGPAAAIVPNVEGAKMTDAVVQLVNAHLCVKLLLDKKLPPSRVERQAPPFGTSLPQWSLVTILVGLPHHKKTADKVRVSVAVRGSAHRCPPIRAVVHLKPKKTG